MLCSLQNLLAFEGRNSAENIASFVDLLVVFSLPSTLPVACFQVCDTASVLVYSQITLR